MEDKLTQIRDLIEDEVSEPTWNAINVLLHQINDDYNGALEVGMENLRNSLEVKRLTAENARLKAMEGV